MGRVWCIYLPPDNFFFINESSGDWPRDGDRRIPPLPDGGPRSPASVSEGSGDGRRWPTRKPRGRDTGGGGGEVGDSSGSDIGVFAIGVHGAPGLDWDPTGLRVRPIPLEVRRWRCTPEIARPSSGESRPSPPRSA